MSESTFHHLRASRRQWWLVVTTGALTLVCGSIGLWQYDHVHATHDINPVFCGFGALYHSMQMLILHTPHFEGGTNGWIEAGRWFGAFTLVATTWMLLWKRMAHEFRLFQLTHWRGHHVVCGLGQKGMEVVRHLKEHHPKARIAVVDPRPDEHFMDECAGLGVCIIHDDATKPEVLAQARVAKAKEVIVITPGDETNVRIATEVRDECAANPSGRVDCYVHLSNIHLRERLQRHAENGGANCALHFFDVFDNEARRVLTGLPLDGSGITEDDPHSVHVVIIGSGRMGRSLALRAAKMGHFANRKPVRISIIDRNAGHQRKDFLFRYPALENAKSGEIAELTFHQADAESLSARNLIEGWAAEPDTLVHLFICLDDNSCAVEVGLRFQEVLLRHAHCNLLVRIKTRESLAGILESPPSGSAADAGPRIQTFGMVEDGCCEQAFRHEHNEAYARAAHEDFVRRRLADSNRKPGSDPALNDWSRLQEDLRESNRQQADHAAIKLRAIGCEILGASDSWEAVRVFTPAEIELLAGMEHARWNAERLLSGWRYGTPSNKKERINENIRPWDELDDKIKEYDRQAVANIPAILESSTPPMKVVRKLSS